MVIEGDIGFDDARAETSRRRQDGCEEIASFPDNELPIRVLTRDLKMWPSAVDFPGTFSDMFVRSPETQLSKDDKFIAYMTPTRPDFWWGAYLVSRDVVTENNLSSCLREWEIRLGTLTDIKKKIIQWEIPIDEFPARTIDMALEFSGPEESISTNIVLVAKPSTMNTLTPGADAVLVEATTERHFVEIIDMELADLENNPESPATEDFLRWKHDQFYRGVKNGAGRWWMLKHKGEIVANCGLFSDGRTARFRDVATHPRSRRQGFARMLCQLVLTEGFKDPAIEQVIIVAEHNSSPERIYKSIGFAPYSAQIALIWDLK